MSVKSIRQKPVVMFDDGQFLHILKAEKEGFITVSIDIQESSTIFENLIVLYTR